MRTITWRQAVPCENDRYGRSTGRDLGELSLHASRVVPENLRDLPVALKHDRLSSYNVSAHLALGSESNSVRIASECRRRMLSAE